MADSRTPYTTVAVTALLCLLFTTLPLALYVVYQQEQLRGMQLRGPAAELLSPDIDASDLVADVTKAEVTVYYLVRDAGLLGRERRLIEPPLHRGALLDASLHALREAPSSPQLAPVIPESLSWRGIFIDADLRRAYVDLSEDLYDTNLGPLAEWAMVYGIVNTVADCAGDIETVQLLCNGEPIRQWQGCFNLREPLAIEERLLDTRVWKAFR